MTSKDHDVENGVTLLHASGLKEMKLHDASEVDEIKILNSKREDGAGEEEEEDYVRHQWSSKREYILSAVGYCVGIGNLWRFPYMCKRNGGGAFLIPFLLSLILCGLPLFFLETSIGQFTGRSTVHNWAVCPLVKGMGVGMFLLSFLCFWYYNTIQAWSLYYLVMSFRNPLPWSRCGQWWNTQNCAEFSTAFGVVKGNTSVIVANVSVADWSNATYSIAEGVATIFNTTAAMLNTSLADSNGTAESNNTTGKLMSSAEEFWKYNVLQESSSFHETGHLVWYLVVSLAVTCLFMFLGLIKGIRSSGKVVYVTAVAPYLLLTVLLVRGATLPGAGEGVLFYLRPDVSRLLDPQVWVEAALQVFYSLGPAWGGLQTMASYNKFNNNCLRDSILLTFVCEGTSIFGGFAIFSVLGYMAYESGVSIDKVVSSGPGLAFIVYPEAISRLPLPQLWAVFFFIMIFTLCCDSQLTCGETVLTVLCDRFPRILSRHRMLITGIFSLVCFLTGLPFVTQGGIYVFQLVDWFIAAVTLIIIGIIECVVIAWVYGADNFGADIELMIGRRPPMFMKIMWCFVTPLLLGCLLVVTLMKYQSPTYGDYHYDVWGNVFGWIIALVSLLPIPIVAAIELYQAKGSFLQRLRVTTRPDKYWGPPGVKDRIMYRKGVAQRPPRQHWTDIIRR